MQIRIFPYQGATRIPHFTVTKLKGKNGSVSYRLGALLSPEQRRARRAWCRQCSCRRESPASPDPPAGGPTRWPGRWPPADLLSRTAAGSCACAQRSESQRAGFFFWKNTTTGLLPLCRPYRSHRGLGFS
jgi:hypothetical protein